MIRVGLAYDLRDDYLAAGYGLEIAATTPSSSPGGRLSDSISVMKPCRYFCASRASTSWDLLDTWISSCVTQ